MENISSDSVSCSVSSSDSQRSSSRSRSWRPYTSSSGSERPSSRGRSWSPYTSPSGSERSSCKHRSWRSYTLPSGSERSSSRSRPLKPYTSSSGSETTSRKKRFCRPYTSSSGSERSSVKGRSWRQYSSPSDRDSPVYKESRMMWRLSTSNIKDELMPSRRVGKTVSSRKYKQYSHSSKAQTFLTIERALSSTSVNKYSASKKERLTKSKKMKSVASFKNKHISSLHETGISRGDKRDKTCVENYELSSSPHKEKKHFSSHKEKRCSSQQTEKRCLSPHTKKRRSSQYREKSRTSPYTTSRYISPCERKRQNTEKHINKLKDRCSSSTSGSRTTINGGEENITEQVFSRRSDRCNTLQAAGNICVESKRRRSSSSRSFNNLSSENNRESSDSKRRRLNENEMSKETLEETYATFSGKIMRRTGASCDVIPSNNLLFSSVPTPQRHVIPTPQRHVIRSRDLQQSQADHIVENEKHVGKISSRQINTNHVVKSNIGNVKNTNACFVHSIDAQKRGCQDSSFSVSPITPVRTKKVESYTDCCGHSPNLQTPGSTSQLITESSPRYGTPSLFGYSSSRTWSTSIIQSSPRSTLGGLDQPHPWASDLVTRSETYKSTFIDTHCHIDLLYNRLAISRETKFADFRKMVASSFPTNFEACVAVFCYPKTYDPDKPEDTVIRTVSREDNIWLSFGCHPKSATEFSHRHAKSMRAALMHPKVVALGEIGLDYSGTFHRHEETQKMVLRQQLEMAVDLQLPLVIHCRDAYDDCLAILIEMVPRFWRIHLHCFCGNLETAALWMDTFPNLYIGLTPVITYRTAHGSINTARNIPLDRILLETDSPYFVPGHIKNARVQVSHPGFALYTAERIAEIRNVSVDTVLLTCRENTRLMYGI